jgi:uncharacterized repeat protein (TIGR03837 family)
VRIVDNPAMHCELPHPALRWDIFCRVIDNFGDIGVCWRLACNLAQRGQTVRLWVDDATALSWMAPQGAPGVTVAAWDTPIDIAGVSPGDVLVEAFGCDIDPEFIAIYAYSIRARGLKCLWINLEYLSAEPFAERCHGLPSPVMNGPGTGLTKHFFYPGFTTRTGGLLRETDLLERQARFDRRAWLKQQGIAWQGERLVSLFCYEPAGLADLLDSLALDESDTCLLVTAGRARAAMQALVSSKNSLEPVWNKHHKLSFLYLSRLSQTDFDQLLWACDVNFVRGEDSLVRALWAGKPLVWQPYPQDDGAHAAKLAAFLDWLQAPDSLRQFHLHWNGLTSPVSTPDKPVFAPLDWQAAARDAQAQLLDQLDLATQLLEFCSKTH